MDDRFNSRDSVRVVLRNVCCSLFRVRGQILECLWNECDSIQSSPCDWWRVVAPRAVAGHSPASPSECPAVPITPLPPGPRPCPAPSVGCAPVPPPAPLHRLYRHQSGWPPHRPLRACYPTSCQTAVPLTEPFSHYMERKRDIICDIVSSQKY